MVRPSDDGVHIEAPPAQTGSSSDMHSNPEVCPDAPEKVALAIKSDCRTGERCTRYWFAGRNGGFLIDHVKYVPPVLRHPPGEGNRLKRELLE